ncbi:MAG: RNA ligase family protein [Deltaproteobacteria bacterium]|nr:RNA ligase family protein [Deltaproteobacteria bacterium]
MTFPMHKYPRTQHIEGSRLQAGDDDLEAVRFGLVAGLHLVVEEKVDGANCAVSFDDRGQLLLQSRGHYLRGGPRERHFDLLKTWATCHRDALWNVLGSNTVMFGEWVFAKHTVFYDRLPHYFLEFDLLDRDSETFLSTECRQERLAGLPVCSVPVLAEGSFARLDELVGLIGASHFKSDRWRSVLSEAARRVPHLDPERAIQETDPTDLMEGLYIKHEEQGRVVGRYKFVRSSFLAVVLESDSHWHDRPILPNQLAPGVDLFGSGAS